MTSPRFSFPTVTNRFAVPQQPAFVPAPLAVMGPVCATHLSMVEQAYRIAWERTQAALAPSKVERLYHVAVN